jgi:tetratricopeptide (TPR) repeat protein
MVSVDVEHRPTEAYGRESYALRVHARRDEEVTELERRLLAADDRPLVLAGAAGVGKRALLQRVLAGAAVVRRFPDGVVWPHADLRSTPELFWCRTLSRARVAWADERDEPCRFEAEAHFARARSVLVIAGGRGDQGLVDDATRFAASGRSRVVWILDGAAPEGHAGVHRLGGLPPVATPGGAVALLRALWLGGPLRDVDAVDLATDVGGNPLALALLAGASRRLDGPALRHRVRGSAASGPLDVDAVVGLALSLLDDSVARSLAALALFDGSFAAPMAAAVADVPRDRLEAWAAQGWVVATVGGRWIVPPAIRDALARRLLPADAARVRTRYEAQVTSQLRAALQVGFDGLNLGTDDLHGYVARLLAEGRFADLGASSRLLRVWASSTAAVETGRRWFRHAARCAAAAGADAVDVARFELALARCDIDLDRPDAAIDVVGRARVRLPEGHPVHALALNQLASAAFAARRYADAANTFQSALDLALATGADAEFVAAILGNLGQSWSLAGRLPEAEDALRRSIARKKEARTLFTALPELNALGLLLLAAERDDEAVALLQDALRIVGPEGDRQMRVFTLHSLAVALLEQGEATQAYEAIVAAFEALVPEMHREVDPLARLTWLRASLRASPEAVEGTSAAEVVQAGLAAGGTTGWYAALAVAELLAFRRDDVGAAREVLGWIRAAPVEAHIATIVRRAWRRLGGASAADGSDHGAAADHEALAALLRRVAPDLFVARSKSS